MKVNQFCVEEEASHEIHVFRHCCLQALKRFKTKGDKGEDEDQDEKDEEEEDEDEEDEEKDEEEDKEEEDKEEEEDQDKEEDGDEDKEEDNRSRAHPPLTLTNKNASNISLMFRCEMASSALAATRCLDL